VAWPKIFQTDYFNDRLETTARANIARFTADLREQGF
jgi:predicted metal-dependent HD superfamily phosphohydrolase